VRVAEISERVRLVITQRVDGNVLCIKFFHVPLQLDQLRTTGWSPDGRAVEDEQGGPARPMRMKIQKDFVSGFALHIGHRLADHWTGGEFAFRVGPRSNTGLKRADKTITVTPAFICLGTLCFDIGHVFFLCCLP
jgi:hypothetical protein